MKHWFKGKYLYKWSGRFILSICFANEEKVTNLFSECYYLNSGVGGDGGNHANCYCSNYNFCNSSMANHKTFIIIVMILFQFALLVWICIISPILTDISCQFFQYFYIIRNWFQGKILTIRCCNDLNQWSLFFLCHGTFTDLLSSVDPFIKKVPFLLK